MADSGKDADVSIQNILTVYSIKIPEDQILFYKTWAERYEKDVALINYRAPIFAAEMLDPVFPKERDRALVLDVCCGTGMVADQNFHGIDGSEEMLKVAESKGLYQSLKKCLILPDKQLPATSDTYDLVTVIGCLTHGLLSIDVLPELLRITKLGAYLCLSAKDDKDSNYLQQLLVAMDDLENQGLWTKAVKRTINHFQTILLKPELDPEYIPGLIAIYRKPSR